jgi:DNA/RNA endonuclease YhcR with UshA esterase domain
MPSPSPTARAPRSLHTLSAADVGEDVLVAGEVVALEGFNGGLRATLDDGTAQVILLLWEDVHRALTDPTSLDVGAEVWVEGEVQEYRGELEVVPWDGDDVEVVLPAPPPPWVEVASLSASDAGRVVRLRGVLGPPEPFSAGVKVPLDDGTGTITVLLWESVVVGIEVAPEVGLILEVVGTVELYRSELEVVPRSPYDWRPGGP